MHASAYGVGAGFALFVAQLFETGLRWPEPELSANALMTLFVCVFLFAVVAVARNRMLDQQ
jgi:hypothetical protein